MSEISIRDDEVLANLWKEGRPMSFIAARLGISRSAVAGRIKRAVDLGLLNKRGRRVVDADEARLKKRLADAIYRKRKAAEERAARPPKPVKEKSVRAPRPKRERAPVAPAPDDATTSYMDIKLSKQCAFIYGEDYLHRIRCDEAVFCGLPKTEGSPYCADHHRVTHTPVTGKKGALAKPTKWNWNRPS